VKIHRALVAGAKAGSTAEIRGGSFRHLVRVLRHGPGDPLVVFDGEGGTFEATIESIDPIAETLRVRIGALVASPPVSVTPLAVGVGIPRGDALELAVRWGSEMGLARLIPLVASRCTAKPPTGDARQWGKLERLRKIAREAAEQCGRAVPLAIDDPVALSRLLEGCGGYPSRWIAVPGGVPLLDSGLLDALREAPAGADPAPRILVLVGPEGGFGADEVTRAEDAGFRAVGFPTPVLRTPTAVAYLSALASLAGLRPAPPLRG
jgi:16S rRNA (uracil1498-N3)-methyltransferase